jgi:2-polyprenyl-3-methyl-5-hydroxy-6-metoxy-1,4-benzoquinol methylase
MREQGAPARMCPTEQPTDPSNGYEAVAERFMLSRHLQIGAATVREWSKRLPRGGSVLDLGCGHGLPISQVLIQQGFVLYGVDASAKLITVFRAHFPDTHAECAAVEDSDFFGRTFDGVVAWGLLFLLPPHSQMKVMHKVSKALQSGGHFLFTSPREAVTWSDAQTGRESCSLGFQAYDEGLQAAGLVLVDEACDEGDNHYYFAAKP